MIVVDVAVDPNVISDFTAGAEDCAATKPMATSPS
jgi:hypothetical protein